MDNKDEFTSTATEQTSTRGGESSPASTESEAEKRLALEAYHKKIKNLLRDFGLENIFEDALKNKRIKLD